MPGHNEKLLFLLGEDARTSYAKLGREVRRSPQHARYLVQGLEDQHIPTYYTLVDYSHLGLLLFRVYFRGGFAKESEISVLVKTLSESELVTTIKVISGPYDLQVDFMARNPSRFNKELKSIISKHKELSNYDVVIMVVAHHFPRNYLIYKNHNELDVVTGGDRKAIELSSNESRILHRLVDEPRATISSISNELNLNVRTVMSCMKKLEKDNVVRAYKADYNMQHLSYVKNRITLKLHNIDIDKEQKLVNYCIQDANIVGVSKTIGSWDIEIDVEARNSLRFRQIYLGIRENFKDIIQAFNYFSIFETHKKSYVPEEYFNND